MRSVSAASCAVVLSCLAVGSCSFVPDFLAWANPWDGLKKYLFQDEVSPLDTTPGNSSSVLHHDVAPWTKGRTDGLPGKLSPGFAVSGPSARRRPVLKADAHDFPERLDEFRHKEPVVLRGLVRRWPATREWTWEQLADPAGKYRHFHLEKHLQQYFSTHAKNENLFLENIILQPPFSEDCPFATVTQQGDGPSKLLGSNFLPRLNQAWSESKKQAIREGLLDDEDYAESVQGFIIAGPAGAGGMLHMDPDSTAYWNALVHGRKRWMFLKPEELDALADALIHANLEQELGLLTLPPTNVSRPVTTRHMKRLLQKVPAIHWFGRLMPLLQEAKLDFGHAEVIVEAGELVYGPPGIWHIALALEDSICCSEQLIDDANLVRFVKDEGQPYEPAFAYLGCQAWRDAFRVDQM
ncbi:unnamed protein product [Symbiodinium natans]|uniref:JmjC domain-containing protein n=1 Tax=Symbiodinium natans TaxID=878477 RepID=A0A812NBK3_9DINO|nr:unnamed protein product [Symbiodinium natans]